jgi:hypothetical protein
MDSQVNGEKDLYPFKPDAVIGFNGKKVVKCEDFIFSAFVHLWR